jgi:hypothetical protein
MATHKYSNYLNSIILIEFNVEDIALKREIINTYTAGIQAKSQVTAYFRYVNDTPIIYKKQPATDVQNILAEFTNALPDLIFITRSGHGHKTASDIMFHNKKKKV